MTNLDASGNKIKREAVSEKSYLNLAGQPCAIDEGAVSLQYIALPDKKGVVLKVSEALPEVILMLALFGASTNATIKAKANRDATEGAFPSDADAVLDWFTRLAPGDWGNKAGGGFAIDVDVLAEALALANPKFAAATGNNPAVLDAWKAKQIADPKSRSILRNHKDVAPHYDRLIREKRPAKESGNLDDLLDLDVPEAGEAAAPASA